MKKFIFILLAFLATTVNAQNIALNFTRVPVVQFLEATYKAILKQDYVIDPALVADQKQITINIKSVSPQDLPKVLADILSANKITATKKNGVNYIQPTVETPQAFQQSKPEPEQQPLAPIATITDIKPTKPTKTATEDAQAEDAPITLPEYQNTLYYPKNRKPSELQQLAFAVLGFDAPILPDAILLRGTPDKIAKAITLLDTYDGKQSQEIIVKAVILEYTSDKTNATALQAIFDLFKGKLRIGLGQGVSVTNFLKLSLPSIGIDGALTLVNTDNRFELLSKPFVRVKNGNRARFVVGSDVPTLDSIQTDKNGNPVQSVSYKTAGVIFEFMPTIIGDKVEIQLNQQLSQFQQTKTSGINSPTIYKRELQTTFTATGDELTLIGGLDEEKNTEDTSSVTFMPWFKSNSKNQSNTQIIIILEVQRV